MRQGSMRTEPHAADDPSYQGYVGRPRQNAASLQQAIAGADSAPLTGSLGRFFAYSFLRRRTVQYNEKQRFGNQAF
ncbi:protein of unknown function [Methylocella tundrae]|uniref:Uncharacterized protein n=1 Tax=Methylocella tundrae TaxID=227605 RepID=A0A4U8YY48_METTU|nr:protein of unknown function [Methylocella tundrae]